MPWQAALGAVGIILVDVEGQPRRRAQNTLIIRAEVSGTGIVKIHAIRDLKKALAADGHVRDGIAGVKRALPEHGAHGLHLKSHAYLAQGHARVVLRVPPVSNAALLGIENVGKQDALLLEAYGADVGDVIGGNIHALSQAFHASGTYI